jgi:glucoamylase
MSANTAFGQPGLDPTWAHSDKDGVGTSASVGSRIWFTLWHGAISEVFYPTIDTPQIRDLQFLVSDGEHFLHQEAQDLRATTAHLADGVPAYRVSSEDPGGHYRIVKEVLADPQLPCLLVHARLEGDPDLLPRLRLYVLCAPHLDDGGRNNHAAVMEIAGRRILVAEKDSTWLALAATVPFTRLSCGYVGRSDGWTDLHEHLHLEWTFDEAPDGNVALTGEIDLRGQEPFTVGLAFGTSLHHATTTLFTSLGIPFSDRRTRYVEEWQQRLQDVKALEAASGDGGRLYRSSCAVLLAHEDKIYPGAMIASLSTPWGQVQGDGDNGGYHLVWPRDMVQGALGLLAAGRHDAALRTLVYLLCCQEAEGGFAQNLWIDGETHWSGIQLDETALPIILAWIARRERALGDVDPYPMILRGVRYLIVYGPATEEERWEMLSGYSPSTLAVNIAALICAADFARADGDTCLAGFLEDYADFLNAHVERWTVTTGGTLVPGITRHYIRILPMDLQNPRQEEDPNQAAVQLGNLPPQEPDTFPAREIVDTGFLELVRWGPRRADDPLIVDSLRVVDAVLKVDTPVGPGWHRFNHDGYGNRDDGSPYDEWGRGRLWPLLSGERGHYELAAGHDPRPLIRAMEGFASSTCLLPEQVWDTKDLPEAGMYLGRPTGSAMPLMWAHAEYVRLLRSARDGRVFDRIDPVAHRYQGQGRARTDLEVWKFNRQVRRVAPSCTLRILATAPFRLHWSLDDWQTTQDTASTGASLGIEYVDLPIKDRQSASLHFTFFWPEANRWEGADYTVEIE